MCREWPAMLHHMKKRAFLVSGGAVAGLAATVAVNPIAQSLAAPATINTSAVAVTTKTSTASSAAKATTTKAKATASARRTITGAAVQERYGTVQVAISVTGRQVTGIQVLQAPGGRNQQFADYAVPILTQEVLAAQTANVSMVSGATFISSGFLQSVASAMSRM